MSPQGYKNMDLESQDPIFNANLGQDENLIWTKKLRCSHSINLPFTQNSSEIAHDQMLRRTPHFTSMLKFVTANTPRYLTTFTKHVTFDQMI